MLGVMVRRVAGLGLIILVALGLLYLTALPGDLPADSDGGGFAGTYLVNGVDPTGLEYSGTVVISATEEVDRFDVEWIVTGGIQRGDGRLVGDTFEVRWETVASGAGAGGGSASYTVEPDGRLVGTKSVAGSDDVGTEEIFPSAQDDTSTR